MNTSFKYSHYNYYYLFQTSILLLINKSFTFECFPDLFKIARVVPIFKGGSRDDMISYIDFSFTLEHF